MTDKKIDNTPVLCRIVLLCREPGLTHDPHGPVDLSILPVRGWTHQICTMVLIPLTCRATGRRQNHNGQIRDKIDS